MKIYTPILNNIITALQKIIYENYYSDKVLEYLFKTNKKLGKRDRSIIAETVYNIVRYYYLLEYLSADKSILGIVNYYFQNLNTLNQYTINEITSNADIPERILLSFNDDLWNEGIQSLGKDQWLTEAKALNQSAPLVIRTNTIKITKEQLQEELFKLGIETIENTECPEALIITNKKFLSQNDLFKKGYYEFQDLSSQKVARFIPEEVLQNAHRIIDACAGAGGKTLHLSALKQNKGQIIALDVEDKKLHELHKRSNRAGCSNIQIKPISSSKIIKRLKHSADIVLIDAPCSGTGVIKRNPDTKLKFSSQNLNELIYIQRNILKDYCEMLKPDGYLLYVTCSILKKENEDQIQWFLNQHPEFKLLKEQTLLPSQGFDGFYMALLKSP
ncbi:MAG: RNA methyltransferase [Bacteroidia bacterium]|nr:MAG: RNA methyltransferase [Bacteroidia bacterium]